VVSGATTNYAIKTAGGSVDILGPVSGDVRVAGGQITIGERVGGDLIVMGGNVHILSGSLIAGDVIVVGGRLLIDGTLLKSVRFLGGELVVKGHIGGSVSAKVSESITLAPGSSIKGDLSYTAPREGSISDGALIGGTISFTDTGRSGGADLAALLGILLSVFLIGKLLIFLGAGLFAVIVYRRHSTLLVSQALSEIPKNTLVGFVALIVTPIAIALLFVTVIGILPALVVGLLYALLCVIAKIYAGVLFGALLAKWIRGLVILTWKWAALGIVTLQLVSLVPIIGWVIAAVFMLLAFGTLCRSVYEKYWLAR
jgi:hypothetical protein